MPKINIDVPHILKLFPPGPGQGEVYDMGPEAVMTSTNIPELRFRKDGVVRLNSTIHGMAAIGGTSLPVAKKGLLMALDEKVSPNDEEHFGTPSFRGLLRLPLEIPEALVWRGSRLEPLPPYGWPYADMDDEDQVDIDKWSWQEIGINLADHEGLSAFSSRNRHSAHGDSIRADVAQFQATKMTLVYTVITSLGNAFLVFPLSPHEDDQPYWDSRVPIDRTSSWHSVQVYSTDSKGEKRKGDKVTAIAVNQPFGLCTVGTSR